MQKNRQKMFLHPPASSSAQKNFKLNQSHKPPTFCFCAKTHKKPNALRFRSSSRSPPLTNPAICSLHVAPESPPRHEPNLRSWHTNPEKSYVHRASLSPSGACVLVLFCVVRAFSAGQLFCLRACLRACFCACLPSVLMLLCFFRSIRASDRFVLSCFVLPVLRAVLLFCFRACLLSVFCAFDLSIDSCFRLFHALCCLCFVLFCFSAFVRAFVCARFLCSCSRIRNRPLVCAGTDDTAAPTPTAHPTNTDRA